MNTVMPGTLNDFWTAVLNLGGFILSKYKDSRDNMFLTMAIWRAVYCKEHYTANATTIETLYRRLQELHDVYINATPEDMDQ